MTLAHTQRVLLYRLSVTLMLQAHDLYGHFRVTFRAPKGFSPFAQFNLQELLKACVLLPDIWVTRTMMMGCIATLHKL